MAALNSCRELYQSLWMDSLVLASLSSVDKIMSQAVDTSLRMCSSSTLVGLLSVKM